MSLITRRGGHGDQRAAPARIRGTGRAEGTAPSAMFTTGTAFTMLESGWTTATRK